jgi:hypothetical protein
MELKFTAEQAEIDKMVEYLATINPAAKALKAVRLDEGKIQARVQTPMGEVKADLVLEVTTGDAASSG